MVFVGAVVEIDGAGLPWMADSRFAAVPPLKEDFAEWVLALTGEVTDSVDGGLLVGASFFSVGTDVVVEGGFVVLVPVVAEADGGLRAAAEVTDPDVRAEVLRSAVVVFRSGDFGVVVVAVVVFALLIGLMAGSFSADFVDAAFFTLVEVAEVLEDIGGLVGGLLKPEAAPGGPARDLSDPVVFVAVDTRLGAADVVEAAFFLSATLFSGPVV